MNAPTVTLSVEVKTDAGFRELTSWKIDDPTGGLDNVKRELRELADRLTGRQRLDLDEDGKA